MAWSARVSNYQGSLDELVTRLGSEQVLNRSEIPNNISYEPEEPIMIEERKYKFRLSKLSNTPGYNLLIRVYGPHKRITGKVLDELVRKLDLETHEVPSKLWFVLEMVDVVLKKHKKVNGTK